MADSCKAGLITEIEALVAASGSSASHKELVEKYSLKTLLMTCYDKITKYG